MLLVGGRDIVLDQDRQTGERLLRIGLDLVEGGGDRQRVGIDLAHRIEIGAGTVISLDAREVDAGQCAGGGAPFGERLLQLGERGILDNDYYIGAVLTDLGCFRADARRAEHERVNLRTKLVGKLSGSRDRLQPNLSYIATARLDECKDVGHQRTFASVCRSFTNSGTALAPSPTTRPALRSAGSSSLRRVICG